MQEQNVARTSVLAHVLLLGGFALFLPGLVMFVAIAYGVLSGAGYLFGDQLTVVTKASLSVAAIAVGSFLFRKGAILRNNARKMRVVDGWTLLKQDQRAPILYLRSFLDDEKTNPHQKMSTQGGALGDVIASLVSLLLGGASGAHKTQEEALVKELGELGPCIAVGDPSESLPDLGASRIYLNEEWQHHVAALIARANLIVFRIGSHTPGFWWEVERVRQTVPARRVAFWIPPEADLGEEPGRIYERFAAKLGEHVRGEVPKWREGAKLLRFRNDWDTAYLSPSFDDNPKAEWPTPPSWLGANFGWIMLAAVGLLIAVQLSTGAVTLKDVLMSAVFGTFAPKEAAVTPSVRSAAVLAEVAKEANRSMPQLLDPDTELTTISSAEGLLIYHYRLVNMFANDVQFGAIASLKPAITKGACAVPATRDLIEAGVSLRYSYSDKVGNPIDSVELGRFDCF